MQNLFLNKKWQLKHLQEIERKAGPRYSPKLNIILPINKIFEGLTRNASFYNDLRKHRGNLTRAFRNIAPNSMNKILEEDLKQLKKIWKNLDTELVRIIIHETLIGI